MPSLVPVLEVHVAQVVLIAQDVRQHGPFAGFGIGDQPHGDTRHGFAELHAGVHQREGSGADRGHRRRAVRLEDVRHDAHGVGVVLAQRNHRLQGAPCQVAVADFAAREAAGGLGLARREGREVIVEHELLGTLHEHLVLDLFVEFRAERNGRQRLRFAAGEREKLRPHADGEFVDAHVAQLRCEKVTELVDKNDEPEEQYADNGEQDALHHRTHLALSPQRSST